MTSISPKPETSASFNKHNEDKNTQQSFKSKSKYFKQECTETDKEELESIGAPGKTLKQQCSSSSGTACCNAEAGIQIANSLNKVTEAMLKSSINITHKDVSHVDQIVMILQDKSLLPPDPKGKFYHIVSKALCQDPMQARIIIQEEDHILHKGIIEGILEDAGVDLPMDELDGSY